MLSPNPTTKVTKNLNQSQKPRKNWLSRGTRLSKGTRLFESYRAPLKELLLGSDRSIDRFPKGSSWATHLGSVGLHRTSGSAAQGGANQDGWLLCPRRTVCPHRTSGQFTCVSRLRKLVCFSVFDCWLLFLNCSRAHTVMFCINIIVFVI